MPSHAARPIRLWTVGHGTATSDELVALLSSAGVAAVVDVRRYPGSRRHPHLAAEAMASWLDVAGIGYRGDVRLGGRRAPVPDSPDVWWRVPQFRAYAAHMRTEEFRAAADDLLADAARQSVAVLCSETLWWRCHRRLIADHAVLLARAEVTHLLPGPKYASHLPSAGVRVTPTGDLFYDRIDPDAPQPPRPPTHCVINSVASSVSRPS